MADEPLLPSLNLANPRVLVVHCSDHRFQAGLREFLDRRCGLQGNFDLLVIPGGPHCLARDDEHPSCGEAGWIWFRFLEQARSFRRAILIAHQDCAWYGSLPSLSGPSAQAQARRRQEEDLRRAAAALCRESPELAVDCYYAAWDARKRLTVEGIETSVPPR